MQLNPITARRLAASLLASVAVLVVAAPAQAEPDTYRGTAATSSDAFTRYLANEQYRADRIGIPNSVAKMVERSSQQVVPYLSQGIGITRMEPGLLYAHEPEYLGLSDIVANDRVHAGLTGRQEPVLFRLHPDRVDSGRSHKSFVGASDGFDWETAGVAAGVAGFAGLLAGSALLAFRRQRRLQGA